MSAFQGAAGADPNRVGNHGRSPDHSEMTDHAGGGLTAKRIVSTFGFWIFLLSDIIMFSAFFATYAVLVGETAGGPSGAELFDLRSAGIETACLLASSFTCGLASIAVRVRNRLWFYVAMAVTCLFGLAFLGLELNEFISLVMRGAGPSRSAFLSAFF